MDYLLRACLHLLLESKAVSKIKGKKRFLRKVVAKAVYTEFSKINSWNETSKIWLPFKTCQSSNFEFLDKMCVVLLNKYLSVPRRTQHTTSMVGLSDPALVLLPWNMTVYQNTFYSKLNGRNLMKISMGIEEERSYAATKFCDDQTKETRAASFGRGSRDQPPPAVLLS